MNKRSLLLVGAGGHARSCIDVIELEDRFKIVGLLGLIDEVGTFVLDYPVIGTDDELPELAKKVGNAVVTLGQIKTPEPRMRVFQQLVASGCGLPVIQSPRAYVSRHARLGAGTMVMHGAVVNAGAEVGRNCIINSQALIEHDATIGDHCHIATAAVMNGEVRVGEGSFIGSGTVVRQGLRLGARCLIGMGQRVWADCADGVCLLSRKGQS